MLRERGFCSDEHREQHHQLLMACLTDGQSDPSAAETAHAPKAAGFINEAVELARGAGQALPVAACGFRLAVTVPPAVRRLPAPQAPAVSALISLFPARSEGLRDPIAATETPRTPPVRVWRAMRTSAREVRRGLEAAHPVQLAVAAAAVPAEHASIGKACPFEPAAVGFSSLVRGRRQVLDPPQLLQDTPTTAGLIAVIAAPLGAQVLPVPCVPLAFGLAPTLPRLTEAFAKKEWELTGAVPIAPGAARNHIEAAWKFSEGARAFPLRALAQRPQTVVPHPSRALLRAGLRPIGPARESGQTNPAPLAALELLAWAPRSKPSLSILVPTPIAARAARPQLAALITPSAATPLSSAQPHLALEHHWRIRAIIWKPDHEAWKTPVPLPAPVIMDGEEPATFAMAPTPRPRFWIRLIPEWRLVITPARAVVLATPLIGLGIVLSALTKPATHQIYREQPPVLERVQTLLRDRSEVLIDDDFLSGISGWDGGPGWASGWSYGSAGFVQPRKLALLRASLPMANYRVELVGQIAQKSLSWAFRATDVNNYYAMKITIAKPGPLPMAAIVRYTVVNGVTLSRVELPLPLSVRNDTLYHVETSAVEDRFTTSINGHVVDTFFDNRHPTGGVGLFSTPGESSRILSVRVVERDDLLGRICAFFAIEPAEPKTAFLPIKRTTAAIAEQ